MGSVGNLLYPPHWREYEDCKQILKLSLKPTQNKTPVQDFSQQSCQKTCPNGRSGIRRLSFCLRYSPTERQSSSIHNSLSLELNKSGLETFVCFLRQILRTPRYCLRTKSLRSLCKISSSKSQKTPACNAPNPAGENDRLRYRSAEWTVSTPWPARLT